MKIIIKKDNSATREQLEAIAKHISGHWVNDLLAALGPLEENVTWRFTQQGPGSDLWWSVLTYGDAVFKKDQIIYDDETGQMFYP